ncbi:GH92 family glycosyl hydrolase [Kutzneria sp. CA-103260]|uniref:GH92 family glycosyl hydrolase n=1 Tax=Kutzneria sp. CA-103260 TaxID=2802641 RepID=UPI001BA4D042|nr:GH92 family glycosyl hydrolase [Kutzneria sp. CA-103260]QUQ66266.1 alpha-1,2-mannosidase [Kutzneria sp. CA-103260]
MRRSLGLVLPLALAAGVLAAVPASADSDHGTDLAAYVNPFVGAAAGQDPESNGYAGDTFPGADVPFGMVQWSPDNPLEPKAPDGAGRYYVRDRDSGYAWEENRLRGFSLTHFNGAGCGGAAGDLPFIPYAGAVTVSPAADQAHYYSTFSHSNESASPGYYKVTTDAGITTELTATLHSGMGRFTFPANSPATLLVDTADSAMGSDDASVTVDAAKHTISGWVSSGHFCAGPNKYKVYFTATFDQAFASVGTWQNGTVTPGGTQAHGGNLSNTTWDKQVVTADGGSGAFVTFKPGSTVQARVGLSYVDPNGAVNNLRSEQGGFDQLVRQARQAWNDRLTQVRIGGGTKDQLTTFYTALYHCLLQPNVFSDVDGRYIGFDNKIHKQPRGHAQYANFSGWDVYRDEIQLLALLAPHETSDIAQSLYNQATQAGGIWDRWSQNNDFMGVMAGDPYHSMIASAYAFGARDFDVRGALASMVKGATRIQQPGERALERPGLWDYETLGYHPDNVSDMLEETTADFGIAQLAGRLGQRDVQQQFMTRAQYWENVYNPDTGYLQTRDRTGQFATPFDPAVHQEFQYQEGNAAQYTWMVPYDVSGLVTAMGGPAATTKRLDYFFTKLNSSQDEPFALMSNEPSFEVPWEYSYAGAPAKTADVVRRSAEQLFKPTADGLPGNDDLGATSSWYVWAALGMYPEAPGRAEMVLASPLFPKITVTREGGQRIEITAPGASSTNKYVQSLRLNGKPSAKAWLPESLAVDGGRLDYTLASSPSPTWGTDPKDAPPSFHDGEVPVRGAVSGAVQVTPGGSATATVRAEGITGSGTVTWQANPPAGITVTPSSGTLTVGPNGKSTQDVKVTVSGATYTTVPFAFKGSGAQQLPAQLTVDAAEPGSFAAAANNMGVSDDNTVWLGKFGDTSLYPGNFAYSKQQLAANGITPGGQVDGFTWPATAGTGRPDNIVANGQTVQLNAPATATRLAFLGAATGGDATGKVTITYTDGSTQAADLGLSEWLLQGGQEKPQFGNTVVTSTPYINSAFPRYGFRYHRPYTSYLFATAPIALAAGKQVRSVTLPAGTAGGAAHVFAVSVS